MVSDTSVSMFSTCRQNHLDVVKPLHGERRWMLGLWLPQKGALGTSGVMEDYKVGPLLFLREWQGQKPVTAKGSKLQSLLLWLSVSARPLLLG